MAETTGPSLQSSSQATRNSIVLQASEEARRSLKAANDEDHEKLRALAATPRHMDTIGTDQAQHQRTGATIRARTVPAPSVSNVKREEATPESVQTRSDKATAATGETLARKDEEQRRNAQQPQALKASPSSAERSSDGQRRTKELSVYKVYAGIDYEDMRSCNARVGGGRILIEFDGESGKQDVTLRLSCLAPQYRIPLEVCKPESNLSGINVSKYCISLFVVETTGGHPVSTTVSIAGQESLLEELVWDMETEKANREKKKARAEEARARSKAPEPVKVKTEEDDGVAFGETFPLQRPAFGKAKIKQEERSRGGARASFLGMQRSSVRWNGKSTQEVGFLDS